MSASWRAPPPPNDELRRKRLEHERRELALEFAAGKISQDDFTAAIRVRDQAGADAPPAPKRVDPATAVQRLRDFASLWASRSQDEQAQMLRAIYARVEVQGPQFVKGH